MAPPVHWWAKADLYVCLVMICLDTVLKVAFRTFLVSDDWLPYFHALKSHRPYFVSSGACWVFFVLNVSLSWLLDLTVSSLGCFVHSIACLLDGDHSVFGVFLCGEGIICLCVDFCMMVWPSYLLSAVHESCPCFRYGLITGNSCVTTINLVLFWQNQLSLLVNVC